MGGMETFPLMTIMRVKLSLNRGMQGDAGTSAKRGSRGEAGGSAIRGRGRLGMRAAVQLMGIVMPQWGTPQRMSWQKSSGQAEQAGRIPGELRDRPRSLFPRKYTLYQI